MCIKEVGRHVRSSILRSSFEVVAFPLCVLRRYIEKTILVRMNRKIWAIASTNFMTSGPTPNELRLNRHLCDAVIKVGDVEFPVHEVAMSACILDFSDLNVEGSDTEHRVFVINDVTPEIMEQIIEFAYTSNVSLTNDNVFDLMIAADRYQISSLLDVCSKFMDDHLSPENCVRVWHVTQIVYFPVLKERAFRFLLDHFEEVVELEEFQQLEVYELDQILDCDKYDVQQNNKAVEIISKWVAHKPDERWDSIHTYLSKIRPSPDC
ncbi:kelch-like protein 10 isoform X2 [Gouania willdenowi]|uniref:kelch-like protein 10 isoform X2 n=1 Tax=Gouania willdenowi TaxID=441366 RepID=UPI0010566F55|nr:kelch-like protein 10 isoform X2 [Gouania willdenowi]